MSEVSCRVGDPHPHCFGKLDPDPDTHYGEMLDSDQELHKSQISGASEAKNGVLAGPGRSQLRRRVIDLLTSGRRFASL